MACAAEAHVGATAARGAPSLASAIAFVGSTTRGADRSSRAARSDGRLLRPRRGDTVVVHADDANRAVGARADRDLAGVQLHDVGAVGRANLEPAFEQRDRRAIRLHGDVELRALDDGHEQRRFDAQLAQVARGDVIEHVAAVLDEPGDEIAVDGLRGNLDVRVVRHADVRASLRESQRPVVPRDDAARQQHGRVRRHVHSLARHRHLDVAGNGGDGDARIADVARGVRGRMHVGNETQR